MNGEPRTRPFLQRLRHYLPAAGFSAWGKAGALSVLLERMKEAACFQGEKPRGVATSFGFTQHKASSPGALLELSKQTGSNDSRPRKIRFVAPCSDHRGEINPQMESLL